MGASGALGASRCRGAVCRASGGVGVSGMYWGLAETLGTQGPEVV